MTNTREWVAARFITGQGIEIGALHRPLKVPRSATVKHVDRMVISDLQEHYPELECSELIDPDIIDDGETLATIENGSQDFIIANHFLEHTQNPILCIKNMLRVLKQDGILYLSVPDKNYTFDIFRPATGIEHLLEDYEYGPAASKRAHFKEWVEQVNCIRNAQEQEREVERLLTMDYSIHYHAWTQSEFMELLVTLKRRLCFPLDVEMVVKNGVEIIAVLRKTQRLIQLQKIINKTEEADRQGTGWTGYFQAKMELGETYRHFGLIDAAEIQFTDATRSKPQRIEPLMQLLKIALARSKYQEVQGYIDDILSLNPNQADTLKLKKELIANGKLQC